VKFDMETDHEHSYIFCKNYFY